MYLAPLRERTQRLHEVTKPVFKPPSRGERGCKGAGGSCASPRNQKKDRMYVRGGGKEREGDERAGWYGRSVISHEYSPRETGAAPN